MGYVMVNKIEPFISMFEIDSMVFQRVCINIDVPVDVKKLNGLKLGNL